VDHGRSVVGVKAAAGLVMLASISFAPMSEASGTCSAPILALDVPRKDRPGVAAGEGTVVSGSSFVWGCAADAGQRGTDAEAPMEQVTLLLRQGDKEWTLGVEDAGAVPDETFGAITWRVAIPREVRPGLALLVADSAELPINVIRAKARPAERSVRRKVVRRASSRRTPGR
jgi:hypothetical protein